MRKPARIFIGNQSAFSAAELRDPFDYAVTNGFDAFEWFPDKKPSGAGWDENDLDAPERDVLRAVAAAKGIRQSVHARWPANPLMPDACASILTDIELAEDLGAALLNIHLCTEEGFDSYVKAIRPIVRQARKANLQLAIENTPLTTPKDFNELFARLQDQGGIRNDDLGMCFDIGHANLCQTTHNDYLRYLDRLDRTVPIIHLHVHENWGDCDSHLTLFTGSAGSDPTGVRELLSRLKERDYSGSIILEQWPHPPALLIEARDHLKRLWQMIGQQKE